MPRASLCHDWSPSSCSQHLSSPHLPCIGLQRSSVARKSYAVYGAPPWLASHVGIVSAAFAFGAAGLSRTQRCRIELRATRESQVLRFVEPESGSEVMLVGCMHFNPASVAKVSSVTSGLEERGALAAVVLEQCPTRWHRLTKSQPLGTPLRFLLDNEMQAAAEVAEAAGHPVVLGDQTVEKVTKELAEAAKTATLDMMSVSGLKRSIDIVFGQSLLIAGLFQRGNRASSGTVEESIGFRDFLDPALVLGTPVAVCRYLFSTALRAPTIAFLFATITALASAVDIPEGSDPISTLFWVISQVLIPLWMLRILFTALLRDRDSVLADSIREACLASSGPGRTVVAVLGAAHCNGVQRILLQSK